MRLRVTQQDIDEAVQGSDRIVAAVYGRRAVRIVVFGTHSVPLLRHWPDVPEIPTSTVSAST